MPKRNFVREIKAKNIKDINPYDIIYLALKDGSIVLVSDNDEDILDYDEYRSNTLQNSSKKGTNSNFYKDKNNKNNNQRKTISSNRNTNDTENNNIKTKYSNSSKDKIKGNSFSTERNPNKPIIIKNINEKEKYSRYNRDKELMNKTYNFGRKDYNTQFNKNAKITNYYNENERLEKSYDNITFNQDKNNFVHTIQYTNKINNSNQRPRSTKSQYRENYKNNQRIKFTSNYTSRTPSKNENKGFIYDNNKNNYHHLINISDININDDSFINRTQQFDKVGINQNYSDSNQNYINNNYRNINSFKRGKPIRSQSFSNRNYEKPQAYFVERKEMEIMGRIVNDDNSYRLIDHRHPNTLFEAKCPYCQELARNNKLCLSNIKEESILNNHSFLASFGGSGKKKIRSHSNAGSNFYGNI
jgi:hypothetical protein